MIETSLKIRKEGMRKRWPTEEEEEFSFTKSEKEETLKYLDRDVQQVFVHRI